MKLHFKLDTNSLSMYRDVKIAIARILDIHNTRYLLLIFLAVFIDVVKELSNKLSPGRSFD